MSQAQLAARIGRQAQTTGAEWRLRLVWWEDWLTRRLHRRLMRPALAAVSIGRRTLLRRQRVVAVIGSYGKTTTTRAVKLALGLPDPPWTSDGRNAYAMVAEQLLRQAHRRRAVIEVGIGAPGQMDHYARALQPDVVVVTSLGSEHVGMFDSPEHLRDEKAAMVRRCRPSGTVVLNRDDEAVMTMAQQAPARVVTYGFHEAADVRILQAEVRWPQGLHVRMAVEGRELAAQTQLLGRSMAYVVAAATAVAWVAGDDPQAAAEALAPMRPTPGRLQRVDLPQGGHLLLDHYKSSLETIFTALDALAQLPARRRIVVLGPINSPPNPNACYREVGAHLAQVAHRAILVDVTHKQWRSYRAGWRSAGGDEAGLEQVGSVMEAVDRLRGGIGDGDVVLIKGRGTQKLQRVGLVLAGQTVRCTLRACPLKLIECEDCRLLRRPIKDGTLSAIG
ncbi:MAG TPA: Mur ligase family protein [Phycisphaeraceae bacterium]